jgi:hypothetical protein
MFRYCCILFDHLSECSAWPLVKYKSIYLVIMVSTVCKGGKKWTGPKCVLCTKYSSTALFSPSVLRTLFWSYIVVNGISMLSGWYVKAFTHAEVTHVLDLNSMWWTFFHSYLDGRYTQAAAVLSCCCLWKWTWAFFNWAFLPRECITHFCCDDWFEDYCTKSVLHLNI